MKSTYRRQKPRWVIVRENEEARRAAAASAARSPIDAINARLDRDPEFQAKKAAALVRIEVAFNDFWAQAPADETQIGDFLRQHGGRTAIRNRIVKEQASEQIHKSQMFGSAPLSNWIDQYDVQILEETAIRQWQARKEGPCAECQKLVRHDPDNCCCICHETEWFPSKEIDG